MGGGDDASISKRGLIQKNTNLDKPISRENAEFFKNNFNFPAKVSIYLRGGRNIECAFENKKRTQCVQFGVEMKTIWK